MSKPSSIKQQLDMIFNSKEEVIPNKMKHQFSWYIHSQSLLAGAEAIEKIVSENSYTQELTGIDVVECEDLLYSAKLLRERSQHKPVKRR